MRRLIDFYRLQVGVLRSWRPEGGSRARRILATLIVSVLSVGGAVFVTPGVDLRPGAPVFGTLLLAAIGLAVLNVVVRPVFLALFAGISAVAVAVATLVFQVLSFMALPLFVRDLAVSGWLPALVASFAYAIVNTIVTAIFSISSDDSYFATLLQQLAASRGDVIRTGQPGLVVVQIDGLSQPVLARQLRGGRVPHLARWLRSGRYRLSGWEALLPSQTSASQAGILHGNNDGIPAFRWYEKESGRTMVSNRPSDAAEIVRRVSNGEGLLSNDGASVANLVTGDAARAYVTMASIREPGQGIGQSRTFYSFFASPYNYLGTLVRSAGEVAKELIQARREARAGIVPRMNRGMPYPFLRAVTNVALRDLATSLVIEEMYRGTPVVYVDYTDYDEIAHHSGPERGETLDALDGVDRSIATLEKAAASAARPYLFVVLSDHGQTLGATFRQRYGITLGELVRELMGGDAKVEEATARVEEWGLTNAFLSELTHADGISARLARTALRSQAADVVTLGPADGGGPERPDLVSMASGNLGLVYFPRFPGRATLEQIAAAYPGLVDALAGHPGIGALLVRSAESGALVVGRAGIAYLDEDRVEGEDPTAQYGGNARQAFVRLDAMEHTPDIAVVSIFDPEFEEVAAFEELIGSHGGLGGPQTRPLLMHPAEWSLDEELVGAPAVYRQVRRWAERHLGLRSGDRGSAPALPTPGRADSSVAGGPPAR